MKLYKSAKYLVAGMLIAFFSRCNESQLPPISNGVYIEEAAPSGKFNQQIEAQLVNEADITKTLTARLVQTIDQEVSVSFELDEQMLKEYNEKNNFNYQVLPDSLLSFEKTATIPAGKISASSIFLTIKPFSTPNGESYAIPIKITSVSGPVSLVGNANRILYLLTSPNKQKTVVLSGEATNCKFKKTFTTPKWTVEYWIKVNNWVDRPPYYIEPDYVDGESKQPKEDSPGIIIDEDDDFIGDEEDDDEEEETGGFNITAHAITRAKPQEWEGPANKSYRQRIFVDNGSPISFNGLYLRYWADGVKKIMPTLQCQLNGAYFDSSEFWHADTWYHIAYTYDGHSIKLYKDGVFDNELIVNRNFQFDGISFCTNINKGYWKMEIEFAQIRLWDKCLSQNSISEGMSRQIASDSEGLIGYWKCDEGKGKTLKDSTPNGNDIEIKGKVGWSKKPCNFYQPNKR